MNPSENARRFIAPLAALCAGMLLPTARAANSFQDLGSGLAAYGVSADGTVVVGVIGNRYDHGRPFRWTSDAGVVDISAAPDAIPEFGVVAEAVSADGLHVVGQSLRMNGHEDAFQWTGDGGLVDLLPANTNISSYATAVSADGAAIVGNLDGFLAGSSERTNRAFRWTSSSGVVSLGVLPGTSQSIATGISADGSVVVGTSVNNWGQLAQATPVLVLPGGSTVPFHSPVPLRHEAFRWSAATGLVGLGFLPGDTISGAYAISADGSVIIGMCNSKTFRWTQADGMVEITPSFLPSATSANGSIVVGSAGGEAIRWDATHGLQPIAALLGDSGVDLAGMKLDYASGISADGTIIVGYGRDAANVSHGWIATLTDLPAPTPTPGPIPIPTPDPTPGQTAPVVSISGKSERTTNKSTIVITGRADGSVTQVTYRVNKVFLPSRPGSAGGQPQPPGIAQGTTNWRFIARLKPGRNLIAVVARGPGGSSAPAQVIVTRK